jgi:hypothetical protein
MAGTSVCLSSAAILPDAPRQVEDAGDVAQV